MVETDLGRRIDFERLLSAISSRFVHLGPDEVDREIEYWLAEISRYLGADRAGFNQMDKSGRELRLTHTYPSADIDPWAEGVNWADFDWFRGLILKGEMIRMERLPEDLPPEAAAERLRCLSQNTQSGIALPFKVGDRIVGAFSFTCHKKPRTWPEEIIKRLRLVGEVFTNALVRKEIEEALRESRERFQKAFAHANAGLTIFDPAGVFLEANDFFMNFLGRPAGRAISENALEVVHPLDRDLFRERIRRTLEGETPFFNLETRFLHAQGRPIWGWVGCSLLRDKDHCPLYFVAHVLDVTERKKMEDLLTETNTALKVLVEQREEDRRQRERLTIAALDNLVFPYLEKLAASGLDDGQAACLEAARSNLAEVFSSQLTGFIALERKLTATELKVADLVKQGRSSQEAADILGLSPAAVFFHRNNIRQKLGLRHGKSNLGLYLRSLGDRP
ncbi:MAG: PAS domain S-box protein [Pseudomonadota bacterium]